MNRFEAGHFAACYVTAREMGEDHGRIGMTDHDVARGQTRLT